MAHPSRKEYTPSSSNPSVRDIGYSRQPKTVKNEETMKTRVAATVRPTSCFPSIKTNKMSQNTSIKSRYCPEELNKSGYGQKIANCRSNTTYIKNVKVSKPNNDVYCDVTFVRKLLAMNKKEEMVLNTKLAKLMRKEELGNLDEKNYAYEDSSSISTFDTDHDIRRACVNKKKYIYEKLAEESLMEEGGFKQNFKPSLCSNLKVEYDINGRRVFYEDDDQEDEDERIDLIEKFASTKSKTWINTTTVIKTKSDISCDATGRSMSSKRKSLTVINRPVHVSRTCRDQRCEEGRVEDESHRNPFVIRSAIPEDKWRGKVASQGDGVQNVVAQERVGTASKKKVMKVWNFSSIPKIKPEHSQGFGLSVDCNGTSETKTAKEGKNCRLKHK